MSTTLEALASVAPWLEAVSVAGIVYLAYKFIEHEYLSPLAKIPGPRPSVLGEFVSKWKRARALAIVDFTDMHKQYGPIVRTVWISNASSIRKINATHQYIKGHDYTKTSMGDLSVFSTR
ncbi:hypothetical protein SYNPS1DRAFT_25634 [Syncephalis pseudoplumigaleata]|uniref:Cytochrome P450 n=1 Tax=Syncephalis pseudoplumigaleata TaxID=1712513 RepID=A0A4V1J0S5_9FUNG|nr:hypothetical protein SYNPS1DRAFT_25634 [Syncephalis pseudoplumigaleata]|eukprot:RKP22579.1 hypothetical protein SYNPS1DRAFT_25634 [Syncephalis pseudoplumigaleata]